MRFLGQSTSALLLYSLSTWAISDDLAGLQTNFLSLANGAMPVFIGEAGKQLRVSDPQAIAVIDGNPKPFILTPKPVDASARIELVYELPAATTFQRFRIPNVWETPSPSQTFVANLKISGSNQFDPQKPDDAQFVHLANVDLNTHEQKNQFTDVALDDAQAVRWLKLEFSGGIDIQTEKSFLEFSELIGEGSQLPVPLAENFAGHWTGRGVRIELEQNAATVAGCYDDNGQLQGTVSGRVLRATGVHQRTGVESLFVLSVDSSGALQGLRSTNGAPFKVYKGDIASASAKKLCTAPPSTQLGCGSVIHGIQFEFDSAAITPQSDVVLEQLYSGLKDTGESQVRIEGHTSSEGSEAYNQELSTRRAQAVVDDLLARGLKSSKLRAFGVGEASPIASNKDEAGRSMNRRVEVHCVD